MEPPGMGEVMGGKARVGDIVYAALKRIERSET